MGGAWKKHVYHRNDRDGWRKDVNTIPAKGVWNTWYLGITPLEYRWRRTPKNRYAKNKGAGSGSRLMPPTLTESIIIDKIISLYACYATNKWNNQMQHTDKTLYYHFLMFTRTRASYSHTCFDTNRREIPAQRDRNTPYTSPKIKSSRIRHYLA